MAPRLVGILGGMGPLATLDFMHKMLRATPARRDQEHVPSVVCSIPQIPDRTEAWCGRGPSPLPALLASAARLKKAGAEVIVMPCNTAHLWFDEICEKAGMPMLHIVDAAVEDAVRGTENDGPLGLLATEATLNSGLYVDRAYGGCSAPSWVVPTADEVAEFVTPGIAAVKRGELELGAHLLGRAAALLRARGATALVLGCTEIPIVLNEQNTLLRIVDATDSLARRAVRWSLMDLALVGPSWAEKAP